MDAEERFWNNVATWNERFSGDDEPDDYDEPDYEPEDI